MRGTFLVFIGALLAAAGRLAAQSPGVKLEDVTWDEARQKELSREGAAALKLEGIEWRHAESDHFVYHFAQRWMAERAANEAETYYDFIKRDLKIEKDQWEVKGQIFLFETDESWKSFVAQSGVDRWSGGVCTGNEIYVRSPPASTPFTGYVLPHELSHLVVNRFVKGRLPIWLNEGIAEQQSRRHFFTYTRPRGFNFPPRPNVVSAENYIPLADLTSANDYPEDEKKVPAFYSESVRLVQFLVEDHPKQNFTEFLQNMADGLKFETAFDRVYGSIYRNMEVFEEKFKEVAISKVKLVE